MCVRIQKRPKKKKDCGGAKDAIYDLLYFLVDMIEPCAFLFCWYSVCTRFFVFVFYHVCVYTTHISR